ncbi:MAG: hypothetical protein J6J09_01340 [Phocaeicola sp.]|nr:hypothetical protein [Phocaeicola sp.]
MKPHVTGDKVTGMWNVLNTLMATIIHRYLAPVYMKRGGNQHGDEYRQEYPC